VSAPTGKGRNSVSGSMTPMTDSVQALIEEARKAVASGERFMNYVVGTYADDDPNIADDFHDAYEAVPLLTRLADALAASQAHRSVVEFAQDVLRKQGLYSDGRPLDGAVVPANRLASIIAASQAPKPRAGTDPIFPGHPLPNSTMPSQAPKPDEGSVVTGGAVTHSSGTASRPASAEDAHPKFLLTEDDDEREALVNELGRHVFTRTHGLEYRYVCSCGLVSEARPLSSRQKSEHVANALRRAGFHRIPDVEEIAKVIGAVPMIRPPDQINVPFAMRVARAVIARIEAGA